MSPPATTTHSGVSFKYYLIIIYSTNSASSILAFTSTSTWVFWTYLLISFTKSFTVIKPDVLSLPLDEALLLSQEKFHPNIPCLFSTSLIVHANSSSDTTRYHNRSLANTLNCAKRSISASLTEKPLTMIASLLVSPTSRRHSTRKKTPLLCAECSGVPILVFRPFVAHLLYGVPLAMSLVSCLFMELVSEWM